MITGTSFGGLSGASAVTFGGVDATSYTVNSALSDDGQFITVTIVAILAAIAYPSYQSHVTSTHRSAAKACLSEYAQFMERYYTTNFTYDGAAPALACSVDGEWDAHAHAERHVEEGSQNVCDNDPVVPA